jgi:hypothetical protein
MPRHMNHGLRKVCRCPRRQWAKCEHPWHFNFKPKGGPAYRFSLDSELGRHIESKTEAEAEAGTSGRQYEPGRSGGAPIVHYQQQRFLILPLI